MKQIYNYLMAGLCLFACAACTKLVRDNPYDHQNPHATKGFLIYNGALVINDQSNGIVNTTNHKINIAEHISLSLTTKNLGEAGVTGVKATITPYNCPDILDIKSSDGASGTGTCNLAFGTIAGGGTVNSSDNLEFDVSLTAHDGERLVFSEILTDDQGHVTNDTFSVQVSHFTPNYQYTLASASINNNDQPDGKIRAGTSLNISFQLRNTGKIVSDSIHSRLRYDSAQFSFFGQSFFSFPGQVSGGLTNAANFNFTINKNVPAGTTIKINLDIYDRYNNLWTQPISFTTVP